MNLKAMLDEVESCRIEMHRLVDAQFDLMVRCIENGTPLSQADTILPLTAPPAMFKGKKPKTIIFSDGRRVEVSRWKTVAVVILRNCLDTPGVGERMMAIRGKVLGRQRTILAATPKGMNVPLEINPEMFFNTNLIPNPCFMYWSRGYWSRWGIDAVG